MKDSNIKTLIKVFQDTYSINELSSICGVKTSKINDLWEEVYQEQKEYNLTQPWVEDVMNNRNG